MTGDDEGAVDGRRRTLLKGLALGAVGTAGAGAAWPHVKSRLGDEGGDRPSDHQAVENLVPREDVTHVASGGPWAEPGSWEEAEIPSSGARVHVPSGTTVTIGHEDDARLHTVRVDGTLRTDPETSTRLHVDTLVVGNEGLLQVGTADAPDVGGTDLTFIDRGPIDEEWDPTRVSRGLLATNGASVELHGAPRTSFLATADAPTAGDGSVTLVDAPTGWETGDEILLAGVNPERDEDELRTVTSVDGATVTFEEPLTYDHVPPAEDLSTYVANLERSVRLHSENLATKHRGHAMFMNLDVTVANVAFDALGRTDKARPVTDPLNGEPPADVAPNPQARYACHFHRVGIRTDRDPATVTGCVVRGSPGWGYVNHNSYVEVTDSVSYQAFGAGFVAEVGNEVGAFRRNLAVRSPGSGERPDSRQFREGEPGRIDDFGHGGHGFWLHGPGVAVEDNVAAGHRHHGFVYWTREKPDKAVDPDRIGSTRGTFPNFPLANLDGQAYLRDADVTEGGRVPSSYVAIRSFEGNTAFASGGGLHVNRHRRGDDPPDDGDYRSVVRDFTAFNVGSFETHWGSTRTARDSGAQGGDVGVSFRYSEHVRLENVRLLSGAGDGPGIGITHNGAPRDIGVVGGEITGWKVGMRAFFRGEAPVRDVAFDNDVDVQFIGGGTDRHWSIQRVPIENPTFAEGGRANLYLGTELDDDLYGLFSPEGVATLDGDQLYFDTQRPEFVPIPSQADVADVDDDALDRLTDVTPGNLVGKSNAELWEEFGISVGGSVRPNDAGSPPGIEGGSVAGGEDGGLPDHLFRRVTTATGSLFERGQLGQGEHLYVYEDEEFLAVPGAYAGLPYLRFESRDARTERTSFAYVELATPATLYVAVDAEEPPDWVGRWEDTGHTLGTTDNSRRVYRQQVDAGTTILGDAGESRNMYTVFAERR